MAQTSRETLNMNICKLVNVLHSMLHLLDMSPTWDTS